MHHDIWNAITNTNPGLAGTILLAGFIGVMAWVAFQLSPTVDQRSMQRAERTRDLCRVYTPQKSMEIKRCDMGSSKAMGPRLGE